jgi:transcriptional regulator with XRE-family HTH domain
VSRFGETIQRLGGLHRLNSKELALALGVSEQTVSELVNGKREPGTKTLMQTREVFEIDPLLAQDGIEAILPEVANVERFERVERKLKRSNLKVVR